MFKITVPQVFPYYSTIIHSCQLSKIKVIIFSISLDLILIMRYNSIQVLSARVAQSVEQLIRNQQVVGSSPISSSTRQGPGATRAPGLFLFQKSAPAAQLI